MEIATIEHYLSRAQVARPELLQLRDAVAARQALMKVSWADFFITT